MLINRNNTEILINFMNTMTILVPVAKIRISSNNILFQILKTAVTNLAY